MGDDAESEVKGWPAAFCVKCQRVFPQREAWVRTCAICFKADKGYNVLLGDKAFLWAQIEISHLQDDVKKLQAEIMRLDAELKTKAAAPPPAPGAPSALSAVTPSVLKDLIMLCHPDKHDNAERATRTTQLLLDIRAKLK
jgi:hypothetical protein